LKAYGGVRTPSERSVMRSLISTCRVFSLLFSLLHVRLAACRCTSTMTRSAPFCECLLLDFNPLLLERRHFEKACASGSQEGRVHSDMNARVNMDARCCFAGLMLFGTNNGGSGLGCCGAPTLAGADPCHALVGSNLSPHYQTPSQSSFRHLQSSRKGGAARSMIVVNTPLILLHCPCEIP